MFSKKNIILRILLLFTVISIEYSFALSQTNSIDISFLTNYDSVKLEQWINSQSKENLIRATDYLVFNTKEFQNKGELNKAKIYINTAVLVAKKSNNDFLFSQTLYQRGLLLVDSDGFRNNINAGQDFEKAKEILIGIDNAPAKVLLCKVYLEIANLIIQNPETTDYKDALPNLSNAYELNKQLKLNELSGQIYKNFGLYYFYQDSYFNALACFEQAEKLLNSSGDLNSVLEINTFSIYSFRNLGLRNQAIEFQENSEKLLTNYIGKRKLMFFLRAKAGFLNSNGNSVQAIKIFKKAESIANELSDIKSSLNIKFTIGAINYWEGDYQKAEKELKEVLEKATKLENKDEIFIRRIQISLAAILSKQGKNTEASELFNQISKDLGNSASIKNIFYGYFTDYLISQNNFDQAKETLDLYEKLSQQLGLNDVQIPIKTQKIFLDYKTKKLSNADAVKQLDELILQVKDEQLATKNIGINISFLDQFLFPFKLKTQIQIENGNYESALLHSDSYKSRWLMSKIATEKNFGVINKDWVVSDEAKSLRENLFQKLLVSGLKGEENSDLELQNLLKIHGEKINQKQDLSVISKRLEKSELSKNELTNLITNLSSQTVISYSFVNEFLSIFVLKENQPIKIFKININANLLKEKIEKWQQEIIEQDLGFKKNSRELYDILIKPIESEIANSSNLIIIPEENLWKVPFPALLDSEQKYLIQKFPISYVPSLKILQTLNTKKSENLSKEKVVIGFGNSNNKSYKILPEAENEVKNLSQVYPITSFFLREKATETTLKTEIDKANILHLAVHGKLDDIEPMRSSLILTKDAKNDGNLEIEEIISFEKAPEIVILSACSTNSGQLFKGEGLLSLSWAFLVAGSKNVIGTQWEVDDKATSEQMQKFHQLYSKSGEISKSLQISVLKQIEKKGIQNHPYYWAGFVSIGGF